MIIRQRDTTYCSIIFHVLQPNSLYRAACFANFEGILGFSVPSVIWVGAGKCKSQRNALAHASFALKNKTENGSRLIENSKGNLGGEWNFCRGEGDRLFFTLASKVDICKKDQKHVRAKLVNYCPNQDDHQQWTLNTEINRTDQNPRIINHKPWPFELVQVHICFLNA